MESDEVGGRELLVASFGFWVSGFGWRKIDVNTYVSLLLLYWLFLAQFLRDQQF